MSHVPTDYWGKDVAEGYDDTSSPMFAEALLDATSGFLAELAGGPGGSALELAIGTGRVGLHLKAKGIDVHGIELSPDMAAQLLAKTDDLPVTIGDMTSTHLGRTFDLVYLVFNTIMNVTTQDEQIAIFENAAAHLETGGCFVIELIVPQLAPPGGRVFHHEAGHIGIETLDDLIGQIAWSHHWMDVNGRLVHHAAPYRYVWPPELDLMARLAGMRRRERWADWNKTPFTNDSPSHISVYEKV
jgi:SAM-dependent methyltransferase